MGVIKSVEERDRRLREIEYLISPEQPSAQFQGRFQPRFGARFPGPSSGFFNRSRFAERGQSTLYQLFAIQTFFFLNKKRYNSFQLLFILFCVYVFFFFCAGKF
jgi:hypothetical protein